MGRGGRGGEGGAESEMEGIEEQGWGKGGVGRGKSTWEIRPHSKTLDPPLKTTVNSMYHIWHEGN